MGLIEGFAADDDLERIREDGGLGVFIRSLVGLDRGAAKRALDEFTNGKHLSLNQIEFVDLIIYYLTERGVIDPRVLYESPFTDIDDQGVSGVFPPAEVKVLVGFLPCRAADCAVPATERYRYALLGRKPSTTMCLWDCALIKHDATVIPFGPQHLIVDL